jgi:hypothetical protein
MKKEKEIKEKHESEAIKYIMQKNLNNLTKTKNQKYSNSRNKNKLKAEKYSENYFKKNNF